MSFGRRTLVWVAAVAFAFIACVSLSGTFESQPVDVQVRTGALKHRTGDSIEVAGPALVVRAGTSNRHAHDWRVLLGLGLSGGVIAWALVAHRSRFWAESGELVLWRVTGRRDRAPPALA